MENNKNLVLLLSTLVIALAALLAWKTWMGSDVDSPARMANETISEPSGIMSAPNNAQEPSKVVVNNNRGWVTAGNKDFEFEHPGYFVKDDGYGFLTTGQPAPAMELGNPVYILYKQDQATPTAYHKAMVDNQEKDSTKVMPWKSIKFSNAKLAYEFEYTTDAMGGQDNMSLVLVSPYTSKYVVITYPKADMNGKKIAESFKFKK